MLIIGLEEVVALNVMLFPATEKTCCPWVDPGELIIAVVAGGRTGVWFFWVACWDLDLPLHLLPVGLLCFCPQGEQKGILLKISDIRYCCNVCTCFPAG